MYMYVYVCTYRYIYTLLSLSYRSPLVLRLLHSQRVLGTVTGILPKVIVVTPTIETLHYIMYKYYVA